MTQVAEPRQTPAAPSAEPVVHWIAGARSGATSGRAGPIWNPATGALARQVEFASVADVDRAVGGCVGRLPGLAGDVALEAVRDPVPDPEPGRRPPARTWPPC